MRVLVTGGAGYIGSVTSEVLLRHGHRLLAHFLLHRLYRGRVLHCRVLHGGRFLYECTRIYMNPPEKGPPVVSTL